MDQQLLLDSLLHEIGIIRFLGAKVPRDRIAYRPTPTQRSTLELLQYLTMCGARVAEVSLKDDMSIRERYIKEAEAVTLDTFDAAMERQAEKLTQLVNSISEAVWTTKKVKLPWGPETTVEGLFLNASLKYLVAYRMQLFDYLKGMGQIELGTAQCWLGRDPPED